MHKTLELSTLTEPLRMNNFINTITLYTLLTNNECNFLYSLYCLLLIIELKVKHFQNTLLIK